VDLYPSLVAEPEENPPYQVYRNILRVLVRGGAVILAGLFVILSVSAVVAFGLVPGDAARRLGDVAAAAGFGGVWIWLGIRIIGSRIQARPDGLLFHFVFRRREFLPWDHVTGLRLIQTPRLDNRFTRSSVAVAVLRADRRPTYCLGSGFDEPQPAADTMLRGLQAEYQAWLTDRAGDH
jgi:hypothetical protein